MYCPRCGTQNPDGAQICTSCSTVLSSTATQAIGSEAKTSGLAITSLVLAILSIFTCFLTAIPAIILGIAALVKISGSRGRLKGSGLAVAGLVVPVAVIPLVSLLMAILMPALARTRHVARRTVCGANMRSLTLAMLIYANDKDDKFPSPSNWCDLLVEHANVDKKTFRCPGATEGPCNYAINKNVVELGTSAQPDMVLLFETHPGWNQSGGPEILNTENHNGEGCNVAFVDGYVEFVKSQHLKDLKW